MNAFSHQTVKLFDAFISDEIQLTLHDSDVISHHRTGLSIAWRHPSHFLCSLLNDRKEGAEIHISAFKHLFCKAIAMVCEIVCKDSSKMEALSLL